jgi:hypothetical protein
MKGTCFRVRQDQPLDFLWAQTLKKLWGMKSAKLGSDDAQVEGRGERTNHGQF